MERRNVSDFLPGKYISVTHHFKQNDDKTLEKMLVKDLKTKLQKRGKSDRGNKKELVERLRNELENEKITVHRTLTPPKSPLKNSVEEVSEIPFSFDSKSYKQLLTKNTQSNSTTSSLGQVLETIPLNQIKSRLRKMGLDTTGLQRNLINRLRAALINQGITSLNLEETGEVKDEMSISPPGVGSPCEISDMNAEFDKLEEISSSSKDLLEDMVTNMKYPSDCNDEVNVSHPITIKVF